MWNCVEGASVSFTCGQLNINEGTCSLFYKRANVIMAAEAHYLQSQIKWGTGTSKTVEIERDATVICKWKEPDAEGNMVYRYYCYLGMRQRGAIQNFAISPLGISVSLGEGRVNPESSEAVHKFTRMLLGANKFNLLDNTDGCMSYKCRCAECQLWFEAHNDVNHSRKPIPEFSRPVEVVADVETLEMRSSICTTNTLDKEWGLLKAPLPSNLEAKTPAQIERVDTLVRAQQFRTSWLCSRDPFWALGPPRRP